MQSPSAELPRGEAFFHPQCIRILHFREASRGYCSVATAERVAPVTDVPSTELCKCDGTTWNQVCLWKWAVTGVRSPHFLSTAPSFRGERPFLTHLPVDCSSFSFCYSHTSPILSSISVEGYREGQKRH